MIDRLWRTIEDGIARTAHATERARARIAVYAQARRYRFLPGGKEPGGPFILAAEMMQRSAAKRARGERDVLAARFGDCADLDVYRERRGVFLKQRLDLPTKCVGGTAVVLLRKLRRKILPGREMRKQRQLRATRASRVKAASGDVVALAAAADARLAQSRRKAARRAQARSAVNGLRCPADGCPFPGDPVVATRSRWQKAHSQ